jgi:hypothetical protein
MNDLPFAVVILLTSAALSYAVLYTFYDWSRAFLAICWVPITLFLITQAFVQTGYVNKSGVLNLALLLDAIVWSSLVQVVVGIGLTIRAALKKEDWIVVAIATLVSSIPIFIDKAAFSGI